MWKFCTNISSWRIVCILSADCWSFRMFRGEHFTLVLSCFQIISSWIFHSVTAGTSFEFCLFAISSLCWLVFKKRRNRFWGNNLETSIFSLGNLLRFHNFLAIFSTPRHSRSQRKCHLATECQCRQISYRMSSSISIRGFPRGFFETILSFLGHHFARLQIIFALFMAICLRRQLTTSTST